MSTGDPGLRSFSSNCRRRRDTSNGSAANAVTDANATQPTITNALDAMDGINVMG